jgi:uncharacterized protein YjiS (DUF1127 family)
MACMSVLAALQQNIWCSAHLFLMSDGDTRPGTAVIPGERIGDQDMLTSIARLFNEWKRYSEARRELSHLSDRELADIGITRSDIDRIALGQADR